MGDLFERLADAPDTRDLADERPRSTLQRGRRLSLRTLERRSWRLANGLLGLGLSSGNRIALVCCESHSDDFLVGYAAVRKVAATPVLLSKEAAAQSAMLPPWARARAVLACPEGWELWQRGGGSGLVITDAPSMFWWKALEATASAEEWPLDAKGDGFDDVDIVVDVGPSGRLTIRTLSAHGLTPKGGEASGTRDLSTRL